MTHVSSKATSGFNPRIYGLLFNDKGELLVSSEYLKGRAFNKFPGGGLEPGEGPADAVRREFLEETGCEVEVEKHFYTTDFFIASAFDNSQVIAIYFEVSCKDPGDIPTVDPREEVPPVEGAELFKWIDPEQIDTDFFDFPADRKVMEMIKR